MKREEGKKGDEERETSRGQETYKREGRKMQKRIIINDFWLGVIS
jgi:hypothetical protein